MANTTPEPVPPPDLLTLDHLVSASDMRLFGDPGLVLFGGGTPGSAVSSSSATTTDSLYHGRHRVGE
ncbi:MAG: hypothetical protein WBB07_07620 [Mycobacterium sp.]